MLENILYSGLGLVSIVKDKVEEELINLEKKGKIKVEDRKSFLEALENEGRNHESKLKEEIKKNIKEILSELDIATKKDIEKLKEEIKHKTL